MAVAVPGLHGPPSCVGLQISGAVTVISFTSVLSLRRKVPVAGAGTGSVQEWQEGHLGSYMSQGRP